METTTQTLSTLPAPCMTIDGRPVYPSGTLITPDAYESAWRRRKPGTRVKSVGNYSRYVSVHVESDCGVELEVSALVDLRPGAKALVDGHRCRLSPDGAEVDLDDATLAGVWQRLVDAAVEASR